MVQKTVFTTEIPDVKDETKVEKWDWNALKNALDDSARKFLVSQKDFEEDHSLMNGRLIISTLTVMFSIYGIVYDWYHPFPESRTTLIYCVIAYFISMGILTLYTTFIEKACFGGAKQKNGSDSPHIWKLSSKQNQNKLDLYQLEVELINGATQQARVSTYESSVAKYFDEEGKLVVKNFHNDLAKFFASIGDDKKSK